MQPFGQVTIIGVGLLGGSLALAWKKKGLAGKIVGYGRNTTRLEQAREKGLIDIAAGDLHAAVRDADLVVLCAPVMALEGLVRNMVPALKPGCLLTDVGSVKGPVVRHIEALIPESVHFVGSHPIAGGEQSGFEAASSNLFEGAKCIVTPTEKTHSPALETITTLWESTGMQVIRMDKEEHDYIYGAVSHLPHIVAYTLMNTIGELKTDNHSQVTYFSGAGLKDATRIAASDPVMWRDICLSNKDSVLTLIDQFQDRLTRVRDWIEQEEGESLEQTFEKANKYRLKLV